MNNLVILLPWPPSVNAYWQRGKQGMFLSPAARSYRMKVMSVISEFNLVVGINVPVRTAVVYYPPDKRTRDIDNFKKGIYDGLTHAGVWKDDSLVREEHTVFGPVIKGGLVKITVTAIGT